MHLSYNKCYQQLWMRHAVREPDEAITLEQIPGDEDGERFQIICIDGPTVIERRGLVISTRGPMTETEVRAFLKSGEQPSSDVEAMFLSARQAFLNRR
jgi:hypothetical protein